MSYTALTLSSNIFTRMLLQQNNFVCMSSTRRQYYTTVHNDISSYLDVFVWCRLPSGILWFNPYLTQTEIASSFALSRHVVLIFDQSFVIRHQVTFLVKYGDNFTFFLFINTILILSATETRTNL